MEYKLHTNVRYSWSSAESTDFIPYEGHTFNDRYQIISHLGSGAYSSVWRCIDILSESQKEVALKIHKCDPLSISAAKLEYKILSNISHPNIISALDSFVYYDEMPTSQKYYCNVYELCNMDLETYIETLPPIFDRINIAKSIITQILKGLASLHSCQIMHLDIKPENVLVVDNMYKIADFSAAEFIYAANNSIVGTRYYRAPEILLGLPHTAACDIWAIGCLLFELCTGDILFEPHQYRNYRITRDEDHIAQIIELVGKFPQWMLAGSRRKRFLRRNGHPRHIPQLYPWRLEHIMRQRYKIVDAQLINLLESMLMPDPHLRPTAEQCLNHFWLNF